MATLVLSALGTLIGGPVGGAIGAVIGQQIDQNVLFKPRGREGPRLSDLSVQSSQYGSAFPRVYGRMRVAGTVIWATDLVERRVREGGGKGRPKTTRYAYAANLAVALSSRPIRDVGRIWADGNLLRGTAGDFKVETGFRLYTGQGDQPVDPLIGGAEGLALAPAHRGLAYAVFEGLDLESFGNRIPSLSFELIADAAPVPLAQCLGDAGVRLDGDSGDPMTGIALSGETIGDALETLAAGYPFALVETPAGLVARREEPDAMALAGATMIDPAELLATGDDGDAGLVRQRTARAAADRAPLLRYYDPARDYQAGLRRPRRSASPGRETGIEFAAVLSADAAQARVDALAALGAARRDRLSLALAAIDPPLRPGSYVRLGGDAGHGDTPWRIERWQWAEHRLRLDLIAAPLPGLRAATSVEPGRSIAGRDAPVGPTVFALFDLPSLPDQPAERGRVALAAAGPELGWRGSTILTANPDGSAGEPVTRLTVPAVLGHVLVPPGAAPASLVDRVNTIEVALFRDDATGLSPVDDAALHAGANLAMVGGELLQFGDALPLGNGRYRLSRLWRGRGGTEDRIAGHLPGDPFVLVDAALDLLDDPPQPGAGLKLFALGLGDALPVGATLAETGRALRPLSPVHLRVRRDSDGALVLGWVRRSRLGFGWNDHVDAPLGEDREAYRLIVRAGASVLQTVDLDQASYRLGPDLQASAMALGAGALTIEIAQIGRFALSPPLRRDWPLDA